MSWTTTGNPTWTDAATKSITSVASITGGLRFTVSSHGYSNGDFITVSGTTDYNGAYLISNVATNTFDVVSDDDPDVPAFTSSQTGSSAKGANSLSGITANSNVSSENHGIKTKYRVSGTSTIVYISGAVRIDPEVELMEWASTNTSVQLDVTSGGYLDIGQRPLINGVRRYPIGDCLLFPNDGQNFYNIRSLRCSSGGRIRWFGGTIYSGNTIGCSSGGQFNIYSNNAVFVSTDSANAPNNEMQIRNEGSSTAMEIAGVTLDGINTSATKFFAISGQDVFSGFFRNAFIQMRNGSHSGPLDLINLQFAENSNSRDNQIEGLSVANAQPVYVTNVDLGSGLVTVLQSGKDSGVINMFQEVQVNVLDSALSPIENCVAFVRDTNNNNPSTNPDDLEWRGQQDYTSDNTYYFVTDSNGQDTETIFLGAVWYLDSTTRNEFYRSDSGSAGDDDFTFGFYAYNYSSLIVVPTIKASSAYQLDVSLVDDNSITQATKATVDAYTTIDDTGELYDRAKSWKVSSTDYTPLSYDDLRTVGASSTLDSYSTSDAILYISFTTGSNITTAQIVFESGGGSSGVGVDIDSSQLKVYAGSTGLWLTSSTISANTNYSIAVLLDLSNADIKLYVKEGLGQGLSEDDLDVSNTSFTETDWCGGNDTGVGELNGTSKSGTTQSFLGSNLSSLYIYTTNKLTDTREGNIEYPTLSTKPVEVDGSMLNIGAHDLIINSGASEAFVIDPLVPSITIKTSSFGSSAKFSGVKATGDVILNAGSFTTTGLDFEADTYLNKEENLQNVDITGDLRINTGADSTLTFTNVTVSGNVYNDDASHTLDINSIGSSLTAGDPGTGNGQTNIKNSVTVRIVGVTEGTACKVVANETVGTITTGDVILEKFANSSGVAEITDFNYESAFNPSGLDIIARARNSGISAAAIADDNGSYTDETAEANSSTTNDMNLLPATPVVNEDRYLFGHHEQFDRLKLNMSTAGTGGFTITWQYWNGAWTNLSGVSDGTSSFSASGENTVSWTTPGDWATTTINGQGPYYYVRAVYTAGTVSTVPKGKQCKLDVTRYLPFNQDNTITSSGLTVTAVWIEDRIASF